MAYFSNPMTTTAYYCNSRNSQFGTGIGLKVSLVVARLAGGLMTSSVGSRTANGVFVDGDEDPLGYGHMHEGR